MFSSGTQEDGADDYSPHKDQQKSAITSEIIKQHYHEPHSGVICERHTRRWYVCLIINQNAQWAAAAAVSASLSSMMLSAAGKQTAQLLN